MADARREYVAIFAIGGKLLGSFKGAMTAARAGMRGLQTRMASMQKAMAASGRRMIGVFTKLTATFAALGAMFATFLAANIFGKIFGQASEQATEANKRVRDLTASLQKNAKIHGQGAKFSADYTKKQIELIFAHNAALEKQGVLSSDIFNNFSVALSEMGFAPSVIMASSSALGDLLVKSKGIHATEEDSLQLNEAIRKVIQFGQGKAIAKLLPELTKNQTAELKAIKTREDGLRWVLKIAKEYKGMNKAGLGEAGGKLQQFNNLVRSMAEDIGHELLPAQDEMAAAWSEILPQLKPILQMLSRGILRAMKEIAKWAKKTFTPEFAAKMQVRLRQVATAFGWILKNAKWLAPTILILVGGFYALNVALTATSAILALTPVGWITIAIVALIAAIALLIVHWDKVKTVMSDVWEKMKAIPILGPLLQELEEAWNDMVAAIKEVPWKEIWDTFKKGWDEALGGLMRMLRKIKKLWDEFAEAVPIATPIMETALKTLGIGIKTWLLGPLKSAADSMRVITKGIRFMTGKKEWGGGAGRFGDVTTAASAEDIAATTAAAPMIGALQNVRQQFAKELVDPEVKRLLMASTAAEVGNQGAASQLGYIESVMNRAAATGKTLQATLRDPGYYPAATKSQLGRNVTGAAAGAYSSLIDQAVAGSNIAKFATGNESGGVRSGGAAIMFNPGRGERFVAENWTTDWIKQMQTAAAQQSSGVPPLLARGMQAGGIVSKPTIAQIGEAGPEAVLPIGQRVLRELFRVKNPFASAPTPASNVNFSPNVTIHGNASEAEQKAMDDRLRILAKDFISMFKKAQHQERRLSYESGYT